MESALRAIVNKLLSIDAPTKTDLDNAKFEVSREYNLSRILGNSEILAVLRPCELEKLIPILDYVIGIQMAVKKIEKLLNHRLWIMDQLLQP